MSYQRNNSTLLCSSMLLYCIQSDHHEFSAKAEKSHAVGEQLIETSLSSRQQLGLSVRENQKLSQLLETQWKLTWAGLQEKGKLILVY